MSEPEPTTGPSRDEGAPPDFEQAMAEVEAIIERIEGGEVGLERAISDYERGARLLAQCRKALAAAEQRIEDVTGRLESQESADEPPPPDEDESEGGAGGS